MNLRELRTKRDALLNTSRGILQKAENENRSLTDSEKRDFDGVIAKAHDLSETLKRGAQLGELRADLERPIRSGVPLNTAEQPLMIGGELRAYRPSESIAEQPYQGPGLGAWVRGLATGQWHPEHRALAESLGTAGGFLVPSPLAGFVIDLARAKSVIVGAGAITVPMVGPTLDIPRLLTDVVATWRAENEDIDDSDPTFGATRMTARSLGTLVKIPNELLMDSRLADGAVTNAIAQAMGVALDSGALMGTGLENEPLGIVNRQNIQTLDMGTDGHSLSDFSAFVQAAGLIAAANGPSDGLSMIVSTREDTALNDLRDTLHQPLRMPDVVAKMKRLVTSKIPTNLTQGSATDASFAVVADASQIVVGIREAFTLEISREAGDAFKKNQTWVRAILRADVALLKAAFVVKLQGIIPATIVLGE